MEVCCVRLIGNYSYITCKAERPTSVGLFQFSNFMTEIRGSVEKTGFKETATEDNWLWHITIQGNVGVKIMQENPWD